MTTLGEAWIEVHADTKPFNRELGVKVAAAVKQASGKVEPEAKRLGSKISKSIASGVDADSNRIRRSFTRIGDFIGKEGNRWERSLRDAFTRLAKGNFILTRIFGQLGVALVGATKRILAFGKGLFNVARGVGEVALGIGEALIVGLKSIVGVGGDAAKAASSLASGFARIGTALAVAAAEAAAAAPAIIAVVAAIGLVITALTALAIILATVAAPFAALLNFALAIPAALGTIAVIVGPLVIAFHNLGDAMSLVFEKDPEKLAKGLKKLSPTLQFLVGTLRTFAGQFRAIGDRVQRAFFGPILEVLGPALQRILPVVSAVFTRIASALGVMAANIIRLLASRPFLDAFALFASQVADFLEKNSSLLADIFRALGAAAIAALPIVLQLITAFTDFLTQFATWIEGAITDGRFEQWLNTAILSLKSIWGLVKALIGLFITLFTNLNDDGREFLDILTRAINKFTTWLKSPEGQKALENIGRLAKLAAQAFAAALGEVQFILTVVNKIVAAWDWLRKHNWVPSIGGTLGALSGISGFSGGGVVPYDQVAMVHQGEPILDPANSVTENRSILADAGMLGVLSSDAPVVNVYIGTERLDSRIDYRVANNNRMQARALTSGPRS